ncbi:MAG: S8 family serine peptidase [Bacteroidetes bacterium]|nr:S8 family serine peptidase [Bacteroidota bacterium]
MDKNDAESVSSDYSSPVLVFKLDQVEFNDSAYSSQWNFRAMGYDSKLFSTDDLNQVVVGVLDTGIDPEHEDLKSSMWKNPGENFTPDGIDNDQNGLTDDIYGFNFISTRASNLPIDDQGHGTSVSGIIAATQNNSIGIAGLAPNVKILTLKAFDNTGNGSETDIAKCLLYAWYQKVDIVNMSFGSSNEKSLLLETICDAMEKDGIILIASSGNSGGYDRHYPSGYESVISVGASTEYGDRAVFSMFGNSLDFLAPGVGIPTTATGNRYRAFSGTSAAAPNVAGIAAILKGLNQDFTTSSLRSLLQETAVRTTENGFSPQSGGGVVNLTHALYKIQNRYEVRITSPEIDSWWKNDTLSVFASTLSPNFKGWELYWKSGLGYPEDWKLISSGNERLLNKIAGRLIWDEVKDQIGTTDSVLSIRLSVLNQNGTRIEDRRTIFKYKSPLKLSFSWIDKALDRDHWAVWGEVNSSHPTLLSIEAKNGSTVITGSNQGWRYTGFTSVLVPFPGRWEVKLIAEDLSGDRQTAKKFVDVPVTISERKELDSLQLKELPESFLLSENLDWNRDGLTDLVLSKSSPESEYGSLYFYNGKNLKTPQDSIVQKLVPKDFITFNGKNWLLAIALGNSYLFSSESDSLPPTQKIWQNPGEKECWGSQLVEKDGKLHLIWRNSSSYFVSELNSSGTDFVRTQPLFYPKELRLSGPPNSRIVRYRNSISNPQILIGDPAGNAIVYNWDNSDTLSVIFADPVSLYEASDYIEAVDLNGDGTDELIIVSHDLQIEHPIYGETFPARWSLRVYSEINGRDSVLYDSWFLNFAGESQRKNKIGVLKKGGENWLVMGLHPDLYLLFWNRLTSNYELKTRIPNASFSSLVSKGQVKNTGFDFLTNSGTSPTAWSLSERNQPVISRFIQETDSTGYLKLEKALTGIHIFYQMENDWKFERVLNYQSDTIQIKGKLNSTLQVLLSLAEKPVISLTGKNKSDLTFFKAGLLKSEFRNGLIELSSSQPIYFPAEVQSQFIWQFVYPDRLLLDESKKRMIVRYPKELTGVWVVPELKDINGRVLTNSPFELTLSNEVEHSDNFYITHSEIETETSFIVYFSKEFDTSVLSNQRIPVFIGETTQFTKEIVSANSIRIRTPERPFGSIGKNMTVDFSGMKSVTGEIISQSGSQVEFGSSSDNVENLLVYPNPWNMETSSELFFGNLPEVLTLIIYDIRFRKVKEIKKENPGGVQSWDGRDEHGNIAASGIYLFRAIEKNGKVKAGKFAIIR